LRLCGETFALLALLKGFRQRFRPTCGTLKFWINQNPVKRGIALQHRAFFTALSLVVGTLAA